MTLNHEFSKLLVCPSFQCFCCFCSALNLFNHMTCSLKSHAVQVPLGIWKHGKIKSFMSPTYFHLLKGDFQLQISFILPLFFPLLLSFLYTPLSPSKSCREASLKLLLPKMAAASSHCLRRLGYSLPVRECRTFELVIRMTRLGSARGTNVASKDLEKGNKIYEVKCR